jgi:diadenosine tetraphosphate (Ap4A) HIT family hydrolase
VSASPSCPFCSAEEAVLANERAYARFDKYPVTPGHLLLIPRYGGDTPNPRGGVRGVIPEKQSY